MKFYYASGTCALASHIALEKTGAAYTTQRIDFGAQAQRSPEYLRVNPKGRVPALATDRGVITENVAILLYLAQSFPDAGLAPLDDPFALAQMQAFNSYLASTVHIAHAHKVRGSRWSDDAAAIETMKAKVAHNMAECFALIDGTLLAGPWVLGETFSTADAYLYTLARWLPGDGVDARQFAKVWDHMQRMEQHPAVQGVLADEGLEPIAF